LGGIGDFDFAPGGAEIAEEAFIVLLAREGAEGLGGVERLPA